MDYFQAQRLASQQSVSADIIEKDFLIEMLLFYLGREQLFKEKLIFRGGTALKKIYFPYYRFSEDLDFLVGPEEQLKIYKQKFHQIVEIINSDYPYKLNVAPEDMEQDRLQLFMEYNVLPEVRSVKNFKVDISRDEVIPAFRKKNVQFTYQEFKAKDIELNTYVLESIASDKICRISDVDNEPRDIYDLWYLLKLNINVAKIKEELKKRFGFDFYVPNLLAEIKREDFKRNWERRLKNQIANLPPYEKVIKELGNLIGKKFIKK